LSLMMIAVDDCPWWLSLMMVLIILMRVCAFMVRSLHHARMIFFRGFFFLKKIPSRMTCAQSRAICSVPKDNDVDGLSPDVVDGLSPDVVDGVSPDGDFPEMVCLLMVTFLRWCVSWWWLSWDGVSPDKRIFKLIDVDRDRDGVSRNDDPHGDDPRSGNPVAAGS
jgi:hypothetical protein